MLKFKFKYKDAVTSSLSDKESGKDKWKSYLDAAADGVDDFFVYHKGGLCVKVLMTKSDIESDAHWNGGEFSLDSSHVCVMCEGDVNAAAERWVKYAGGDTGHFALMDVMNDRWRLTIPVDEMKKESNWEEVHAVVQLPVEEFALEIVK